MQQKLVIITPKDIQRITRCCYKIATRTYREIREYTGKRRHQFITIDDFCTFAGLTHDHVEALLQE